MSRIYLKKQLMTNVPVLVKMAKRGQAYPEKKYGTQELTGKNEYLYVFTDASGQELSHYAKEYEEEILKDFSPGDTLQVVRAEREGDGGKRFSVHVWSPPNGTEARAAAAPALRSNVQQATQEKRQDAYQDEQRIKSYQIGLQGYAQQIIPALLEHERYKADIGLVAKENIVAEALDLAERALRATYERAKLIASQS